MIPTPGDAIREYHNVDEIYAKLDHLLAQPSRPLKREAMEKFLAYFNTKCTASKEMTSRSMDYIPGGVQHNLAFNYPFPIVFTKADGAHLYDLDGNEYIDFLQAGGPTVLGSNFPVVRDKCIELLQTC